MDIQIKDIPSIENLIDQLSSNPDVQALIAEVEKVIKGEEPVKNLLGFIPMVTRIAYGLIEKDGTRGAEIEQIVKVIIGLLESKLA